MGDGYTQLLTRHLAGQRLHDSNLVGGQHHGGQPQMRRGLEREARTAEEERAAIGAVVLLYVQTGRPRLGQEGALVAQACHDWLECVVVVVYFLQTQNVRPVGQDLLQNQVLPLLPLQSIQWTADKSVLPLPKSCRIIQMIITRTSSCFVTVIQRPMI